ncbi:P-loop containing nucleoside triphosphate hydrolase protein [Talaromyces proteolyticus]|uniref:Kinesin-like protein n=1 Tax=Talaromyces proteolyticus TaxID=1131652 RepID=A0AAD4L3T5_9EURO|nr:P-loop containing nucleoside triphosphate hydrolase protein [Talaromyces proteolyticus]KAH8703693.1 P-loop containing nucleoside triphosphate hydrolase protein [Talaromyces proteolyticus]
MPRFQVFVRWRPLSANESGEGEIKREYSENNSTISISAPPQSKTLSRRNIAWKSGSSFSGIFDANDNNKIVFDSVVSPVLSNVLQGQCCNFFAYGHSGSGKSHTIMGYNYDNSEEFGLCLAAAHHLISALKKLNTVDDGGRGDKLGIGIRMYEMRKNSAFDLLNGHRECHVREGSDGRVYIRGETEMLEDGKVRVRPITTVGCWSFEDLHRELQVGLKLRATGSSTIHDQSSRTHAVLELEIITEKLTVARDAVFERQSELVPVGKHATDVYIEEQSRGVMLNSDGKWIPNPDYQINQSRIDAAELKKGEFEKRVKEAEDYETKVFRDIASRHACIGGRLVFVDLAGSEYSDDSRTGPGPKQTPQEKQEGRQINSDLLALKEVIRATALNQTRIPFRSSPLTMVLRQHFQTSTNNHSAMILTISPSTQQFAAAMNTLKYGDLVGVASGKKRIA